MQGGARKQTDACLPGFGVVGSFQHLSSPPHGSQQFVELGARRSQAPGVFGVGRQTSRMSIMEIVLFLPLNKGGGRYSWFFITSFHVLSRFVGRLCTHCRPWPKSWSLSAEILKLDESVGVLNEDGTYREGFNL